MKSIFIASIILSILFIFLFSFYLLTPKNWISRDYYILFISILFVISIFFNFYSNQIDYFYFEVSPQRKKCLEDRVSLNKEQSNKSSCACCQKGFVGGYNPHFSNENQNTDWYRADNWSTNKDIKDFPPTDYVSNESFILPKNKRFQRNQKDMYQQNF